MRPCVPADRSLRKWAARALRGATLAASKDPVKFTVVLLALCLAGCQSFFRSADEDAQVIISQRLVGTSVGDFFQHYGKPQVREEARSGALEFSWEGGLKSAAPGLQGPEESICRLLVSADRNGLITAATIVRDGRGERRRSRCLELLGG